MLYDAKQAVLALHEQGYSTKGSPKHPSRRRNRVRNTSIRRSFYALSGYISEHDMKIAKKVAYVIAGGKVPYGTEVDEQYLLDLEREHS